MIRTCVHCEGEFDDASPAKQRAGGKITECPDCSEETETKYLGLQSADGKAMGVTILKFESEEDKAAYHEAWLANSGMHVGKDVQIEDVKTTPKVRFTKIHEAGLGVNHKGNCRTRIWPRSACAAARKWRTGAWSSSTFALNEDKKGGG